ncbi:UNVERIFIED_CONTAM: hypothetical protein K2H54_054476 [Gekko kuhli]
MDSPCFLGNDLYSYYNFSMSNPILENQTCQTNRTKQIRNEEVAKVEVAVLCLIFFLALTGNLCVLMAIHTTRHKHSRMYFFMKHLSIADLAVAIFQVLPQLIWDITFRFYGPDYLCRLIKYLQVVGMFASTYMLLLMSLDRCLAICQPLRSLHRRSDRLSVPPHLDAYITWITLTVYIIPVLMLSICYGLISFKIWQNVRLKTIHETNMNLTSGRPHRGTLSRVSSVKLISKAKIRTVENDLHHRLGFHYVLDSFFHCADVDCMG